VATTYEEIRAPFEQAQAYVLDDLDRIVKTSGGNYVAAVLITCACDAFSAFKYGKSKRGERFFEELLPDKWRPIAKSLYGAIRHGLVHSYDTQLISIGGRELDIIISWGQKAHLHVSTDEKRIYVNIQNLASDFRAAVIRFSADLQKDAKLRETFAKSWKRSRKMRIGQPETAQWEKCLRQADRETT